MNKTKILKLITIIMVPIFLQAFASYRNDKRFIKEVVIDYTGDKNVYITDENIRQILFNSFDNPEKIVVNQLKISELEQRLDANPMIENAEVFLTLDGVLKTKIKQREPIVRIFDKNRSYYLDIHGQEMPLSSAYSARVPVVFGTFQKENMYDIFVVSKYIYQDKFLSENIIQIDVNKNFFRLKMRIADFDVILGDLSDLTIKCNNLKAFYKKASKDNILNQYKQVNLQYSNQVVCVK